MSDFASLLSRFRKRAKISQYALAKKIDMNPAHLNRIERGLRSPPKRDKVLLICKVLCLNEEETDELLIKARYAPQSINIGNRAYEISRSMVYESPLNTKEIADLTHKTKLTNPTVSFISEVLNDPDIPLTLRQEMEKEICLFVEWLRDKMRKREKK